MKFHWGVGIVVFMAVFLLAAAAFIIFAYRQDISLVHDDYYERGANYGEQMEINQRSAKYEEIINTMINNEGLIIGFKELPEARIDSGLIRLYRPLDIKLDLKVIIEESELSWMFPIDDLVGGRYIMEMSWYSRGLQYEIKKPVVISSRQ